MPEGVIDELEVVEVDQQQRDRVVRARRARHAAAQLRLELRPVRKPRERVEVREAADLVLRAQPLGDVLAGGEHADHLSALVAQQGVAPGDRAPLARAGDDVALVVGELLVAAQGALEGGPPRGAVLLGDDDVVPVAADQVAVAVAEQLAAVAVEQIDRLIGAQDEQDRPGHVEVVLRARLGQLAVGDVEEDALRVIGPAGVVADDRVVVPHPDDAPVGGDQPVLAVEGASLRVAATLLAEHALAVAGMQALRPQLRL